ncbi:winged helix-turn-helix transcriptional regulator [Amycolatopsis nalaikhensis]|uniref:Winged helix-turn-helix transcriptional regulator n=1 Tax=Amycolatopsis nalaikhensis TaxID=715472 RepID=A0ABY8XUU3_9PSEU|nr:winged helix-turn-helix transcriptional regulator [Amycolatopsis sp. 2-2]WIV59247.1 winged helix-turn-helix transcriptional regulator [Amycolatopsis sp. 2-2]
MADDVVAWLSDVVGRPGAVEVVEALADGAKSHIALCAAVPLAKRKLERVLRTLAAEGVLVRCDEPGTWDLWPGRTTRYALTASGRELVAVLSDLDVWVAIYERYLDGRCDGDHRRIRRTWR